MSGLEVTKLITYIAPKFARPQKPRIKCLVGDVYVVHFLHVIPSVHTVEIVVHNINFLLQAGLCVFFY